MFSVILKVRFTGSLLQSMRIFIQQMERVHEILRRRYPRKRVLLQQGNACHKQHTARSCAFILPAVYIHSLFLALKKFRKPRSCGSVFRRILHIKNQRLLPSRHNKPNLNMAKELWNSLLSNKLQIFAYWYILNLSF